MYGCFRCGKVNGETRYDEEMEEFICENCGNSSSLVTFEQALDIINDAHLTFSYHYDGVDMDELAEAIWEEGD